MKAQVADETVCQFMVCIVQNVDISRSKLYMHK